MTVVVVVPMLGRPQRAQPLVESVKSTGDFPVVFVCSRSDKTAVRACRRTGERVIVAPWEPAGGDFARKTNLAFRETDEEWVFCGASDLLFHPGWAEEAVKVGMRQRAGVVGTQDLGNPQVRKGAHSTHPLVSRSYIAEYGSGTFDNTGEVYSEAYDHQWVDDELVATARARRRWAFAPLSVVEHLHPVWAKGDMDATYEKALRATNEDRALFQRRMRELAAASRRRRHPTSTL